MTTIVVVNGLVWEILPWLEYQVEQDDPEAQQDEGWLVRPSLVLTIPLKGRNLPPRDRRP